MAADILNTTALPLLRATGGPTLLAHLPTPPILTPILNLNTYLLSSNFHYYFPYPWMFVLHALRCSFAWRGIVLANTQRAKVMSGGREVRGMTWAADIFGFCLMSWGGGILSHLLTGQLPPQFLHPGSALTYIPIHILITLFLSLSPSTLHPAPALLDILSPFIDGATRAGAVTLGINLASKTHPESWMLQIVLGTLTACGGGQACGTIGAWNVDGWKWDTPPALRARNWMEGVDVWAPFLAVVGYVLVGGTHEDVIPISRKVLGFLGKTGLVDASPLLKGDGEEVLAVLDPATAGRALATLIITSAFVWRATILHGTWATASLSSAFKTNQGRRPLGGTRTIEGGSGQRRAVSEEKQGRESIGNSSVDGNGSGKAVRRSARRKT
ncbi:hypothetical protein CF327_g5877 [Tilletia walkeri]|nr:hypothetical protein CF327_g5877 [Tilletia walkeri]